MKLFSSIAAAADRQAAPGVLMLQYTARKTKMADDPFEVHRRRFEDAMRRHREHMDAAGRRVEEALERARVRMEKAEADFRTRMAAAERHLRGGRSGVRKRPGDRFGPRQGDDLGDGVPVEPNRPKDLSGGAAAPLEGED